MGQQSESDMRAALIAAARALMAGDARFTLRQLYDRAGVDRAGFRRCFADRAALLRAVMEGEAKALDGLLVAAHPAHTLRQQVNAAPVEAPRADAWLERRLRVFERALTALESRQEKSEQALARQLALIEEKLGAARDTVQSVPLTIVRTPALEEVPAPNVETVAAEPVAESVVEPSEEPISEKDIADFLAQARRAAQNAVPVEPARARRAAPARWIGWFAAIILLLACAALFLADGVLGDVLGPAQASTGISHRRPAPAGLARVIALADSGDAAAQTRLALAYLRGQGVASDDAAAQRWSFAAASQGRPMAQYLLGTLYLQGDGVRRDPDEAARWFRAAALQGNVKAMHNLAIAYAEGLGLVKDPVQAAAWFARAAGQGYRDSQFDLAVLYERGWGVPQSARDALTWYLVAAAEGDAQSGARAAILRGQMTASEAVAAVTAAQSFMPQTPDSAANNP